MYNYHTDVVWAIDKILLAASSFLAAAIILYAIFKTRSAKRRIKDLLEIKRNVHSLATSGRKPSDETCPAVDTKTIQGFLDVEMNRKEILFNVNEQQFIKKCFAAPDKISLIRNIAGKSRNKWRRIEAVLSLGYAEDSASLKIIEKALADKDEDISYFSILALGFMKNIQSAKILLDFLKKDIDIAPRIISVLETFPDTIVDEAVKLTRDADPAVRFWAVKLMTRFKPARYIKDIEELAKDASSDVRAAACECLEKINNKESRDMLLRCLKDEAWPVRMNAVTALSKILGNDAVPEIIGLIKDKSLFVKGSVKTALSEHIEAALPFIEKVLYSDDEIAKREAVEALEISGYITKLFNKVLSEDSKERLKTIELLKSMITKAYAHFGLETALGNFAIVTRNKILGVIRDIDKGLAEHIEKKLNQQINEL